MRLFISVDIFVDRFDLEPRIEALLLADGGHRVALVVVRGIDQRLVGQLQQPVENRIVLRARIAVLEIGAAGAADQQRVAGENPVGHHEAVGIVGVAGRVQHSRLTPSICTRSPSATPHRYDVGLALFAHYGDAMGAVAQRAEPGDVVGVQMGVDGFDELEIEFAHELQIALDLFQHRIDDQRLAAAPAGDDVSVGAGDAVEELTEKHRALLLQPRVRRPSVRPERLAHLPG